jgi:hypothetical protein
MASTRPRDTPAALHRPAQVTAAWLETALGRRVRSFERIESTSTWATHVRIVAGVAGTAARSKLRVQLGSVEVFGRHEVDYYLHSFADLDDAPLVPCHHAAADDTHYHLLLDDLCDTHRNQDVPVTAGYGQGLVESLAKLHAHRWEPAPPDAAAIQASLRAPLAGLPAMLAAMEDGFTADERDQVVEVRAPAASPAQLRADWQLCVAQALLVPASRCSEPGAVGTHRQLWEMHVRRALSALDDSRDD